MDDKLTLRPPIGPLTTAKLINDYQSLLTESSDTSLLHDLHLYGEDSEFILGYLWLDKRIDLTDFDFNLYFPSCELVYTLKKLSILDLFSLFCSITTEKHQKEMALEDKIFTSYPRLTFAMIEEVLERQKWCFQSPNISLRIQQQLEQYGYTLDKINSYSEHSSILHDLHLYGSAAKKLVTTLLDQQDIDLTQFNIATYFPSDKQVHKAINIICVRYFWKCANQQRQELYYFFYNKYPRLTFTMIETTLEQKKWLYY